MSTSELLVLGGSSTGKTHYAGQLLGRLRHDRRGKLRLHPGGVEDLSKLEEVLFCLEEGRAAGHTPGATWSGIRCELQTSNGDDVALVWPEYAGERLFSIVQHRVLPSEWRTSVGGASGWILFIRPSTLQIYEHLLERPSGVAPEHTKSEETTIDGKGWDDRARFVELLQVFLFAARQSNRYKISQPRLAVFLSCWDELKSPGTPEDTLASRLPLVDAFVRSTWKEEAWSVWGLSSLGRSLDTEKRDPEFAEKGPEHFGYVIPPGSVEQTTDLTAPIAWLLGV